MSQAYPYRSAIPLLRDRCFGEFYSPNGEPTPLLAKAQANLGITPGGGGATPGGQDGSFQINANGALGGFTESDSTGISSLVWDTTRNNGSLRFNDGWGDIAQFYFNGSFQFDVNNSGTPAVSIGYNLNASQGIQTTAPKGKFPLWLSQASTFADISAVGPASGAIQVLSDGPAGLNPGDAVTVGGGTHTYLIWGNGTEWTVIGK